MIRLVTAVLVAAAFLAPAAHAQQPLAGEGENLEILANVDIGGATEMELAGDYAYVVNDKGLFIIDISTPASPKIAGVWECDAGWGDVEVDPNQKYALVANAYGGACSDDIGSSMVILDITDKTQPKAVSGLEEVDGLRAHTITLDGRYMYINTGVWGANPSPDPLIQVYDIADLRSPKLVNEIVLEGATTPHDAYIDHRPDGKVLFYAASGHDHYVIDVTDPTKTLYLQTTYTPQIEYAHQDEPNHDRTLIVASDESLVGLFGGVCGSTVGAIYFYALGADGQWGTAGAEAKGFWGLPPTAGEGGCSAHVFWQAPDQNRLVMGMYTSGVTVLDYEDPMNPKQLGWVEFEGRASVWGAKAHNGHVYASGARGFDVLRYTGEGGKAWPATAGAAEVQRATRMGLTVDSPPASPGPMPGPSSSERTLGRFAAKARIRRVPGRRGRRAPLVFTATAGGKRVARVTVRRPARRRATLRISGVGEVGTYRWTVRSGRKTLARGRTKVRPGKGLVLAPTRKLEVLVR